MNAMQRLSHTNEYRRQKYKKDDRLCLRYRFYAMKQRCYNPNNASYKRYGKRGITVCQEWFDNPEAFIEWALAHGWKRELQLDRTNNDGSYSPENCRWVIPQVQSRNRRDNITDFEKGTRICYSCGEEKPLEEFHRAHQEAEGRRYNCKKCAHQSYLERKK